MFGSPIGLSLRCTLRSPADGSFQHGPWKKECAVEEKYRSAMDHPSPLSGECCTCAGNSYTSIIFLLAVFSGFVGTRVGEALQSGFLVWELREDLVALTWTIGST